MKTSELIFGLIIVALVFAYGFVNHIESLP